MPIDPPQALRDDGTLSLTDFTSLPALPKIVTSRAPQLLDTIYLPDGTVVRHFV
jgi:hypothetical protein